MEVKEAPIVKASEYKKHTDSELVAMCLRGEAMAWEALLLRYRRLIYSIPVRFGFPRMDVHDVFQNVCVKLLEHLHEVKDDRKLRTWIATTTVRQCIYMKTIKFRDSGTEEEGDEPLDPADNLEDARIFAEELQAMRDAIAELPERCRSLIELLYFDPRQLSYEAISETLQMPVPSIGPTRARCFEKLRGMLRRRGINK